MIEGLWCSCICRRDKRQGSGRKGARVKQSSSMSNVSIQMRLPGTRLTDLCEAEEESDATYELQHLSCIMLDGVRARLTSWRRWGETFLRGEYPYQVEFQLTGGQRKREMFRRVYLQRHTSCCSQLERSRSSRASPPRTSECSRICSIRPPAGGSGNEKPQSGGVLNGYKLIHRF